MACLHCVFPPRFYLFQQAKASPSRNRLYGDSGDAPHATDANFSDAC
jgi:hypothetical protein